MFRLSEEQLAAHQKRLAEYAKTANVVTRDSDGGTRVQLAPAQRKYRNKPVVEKGVKFDSKHEYKCYRDLQLRELAGEIEGLRCQVKFSLFDAGGHCRGEHIATYRADFVYREKGVLKVADAKSEKTRRLRDWPRTKALLKACHGYEVVEL